MDDIFSDPKDDAEKEGDSNIEWKKSGIDKHERLKRSLEKWLQKKVVIKYTIKPEILGGLLVECGSIMFDDSLKGKLEKLELLMKGTK